VKVIRSSATDAAASKRMMNITIGLASVAVDAEPLRQQSPINRWRDADFRTNPAVEAGSG
jgi:hypothetical protein